MKMNHQRDTDHRLASLQEALLNKRDDKENPPTAPSCYHKRLMVGLVIGLSILATTIASQATVDFLLLQAVATVSPPTIFLLAIVFAAIEIGILHLHLCYWYGHHQDTRSHAVIIGAVAGVALGWFLLLQTLCRCDCSQQHHPVALGVCCSVSLAAIGTHHYLAANGDEEEDDVDDTATTGACSSARVLVPVVLV